MKSEVMLKISINKQQLTSILSLKNQEQSKKEDKFFCPVIGCLYAEGSPRFFKKKTLLAQHIAKVHAEKIYVCNKCHKGFGTEWLRKNHEEFCGKYWHCSCGHKYLYRESLLTHARRLSHVLPEDARSKPKKLQQAKAMKRSFDAPVVLVIQPVIQSQPAVVQQHIRYAVPMMKCPGEQRLILPKVPGVDPNSPAKCDSSFPAVNSLVPSGGIPAGASTQPAIAITNATPESTYQNAGNSQQGSELKSYEKMVAQTQTCEDYFQGKSGRKKSLGKLESRGSQCSSRKQAAVRIKSIHTQTVESAVGKMKRRNAAATRLRKKSVAVVTDEELPPATQELWSEFEDFILGIGKYSISTQTNGLLEPCSDSKMFRDSQTVTEDDYLLGWESSRSTVMNEPLGLADIIPAGCTLSSGNTAAEDFSLNVYPCSAIGAAESEDVLQEHTADQKILNDAKGKENSINEVAGEPENPMLSLISGKKGEGDNNIPENKVLHMDANLDAMYTSGGVQADFSALDQALDLMLEDQFKSETPELSHIQTQTNAPDPLLGYGLLDLTNMETQTTEDLLFSDLEFSDTETQTPWDDIQTVNDSLPVDQLSIEIQTDFSSILGSSSTVDNRFKKVDHVAIPANGTSALAFGRHMETQTQNDFLTPQFMHSEVQTHMDMDWICNQVPL